MTYALLPPLRTCVFACLTLTLAACDPGLRLNYREGVSVTAMRQDELTCETQALRAAPVRLYREVWPIYDTRRVCDRAGANCRTIRVFMGYDYDIVDANESHRRRLERTCLDARGYVPVLLPPCPDEVKAVVTPRLTRVLPPLPEGSCAIRYEGGAFQIVTPR